MRIVRRVAVGVACGAALVAVIAVLARFSDGPLGPFPGGKLGGVRATDASPDWSTLLAGATHVELEVNPASPRSITTSYIVHDGALYVPSMFAARKSWPQQVATDDRVVLRIGGRLYDRRAVRVLDPAEIRPLVRARDARAADGDVSALSTWYFRMDPPTR